MYVFTYLESAWVEGGAEGEEEGGKILSRLHTERGAWSWAQSHDPEIMTWAEFKSHGLNWLSHPGALGAFLK